MAQTTADQIASWVIWFHHEHGDPVTNLRLQKLLYYAQAWRLALTGREIFPEDFQAWIHGPVIPPIYGQYKKHGGETIPLSPLGATLIDADEKYPKPNLDPQLETHLKEIMEAYGPFTTWQLEQLTHGERPWKDARGGIPEDAVCKKVISKDAMRTYYKALLDAPSGT